MFVCEYGVIEINIRLHLLFHKVEILMLILLMINFDWIVGEFEF
jgi:hypothetical protein